MIAILKLFLNDRKRYLHGDMDVNLIRLWMKCVHKAFKTKIWFKLLLGKNTVKIKHRLCCVV